MSEKKGADKQNGFRTRYYYTDYVNHAVRFYLTTPETLNIDRIRKDGKPLSKADIDNWIAVQSIFHCLKENEKQVLMNIHTADFKLSEGVRIYCEKTGADKQETWLLIRKVYAAIARSRGLI